MQYFIIAMFFANCLPVLVGNVRRSQKQQLQPQTALLSVNSLKDQMRLWGKMQKPGIRFFGMLMIQRVLIS